MSITYCFDILIDGEYNVVYTLMLIVHNGLTHISVLCIPPLTVGRNCFYVKPDLIPFLLHQG